MTPVSRARRLLRVTFAGAVLLTGAAGSAMAQGSTDPGAITVTANADIPSVYFFRGIRQEADPTLTFWPNGSLGIRLYAGDGGVKRVSVSVGTWNSFHRGTAGSDGGSGESFFEADFYSTVTLAFRNGFSVGTTYRAYTSPNDSFNNVKELSFTAGTAGRWAPYGIVAFELSGQADAGSNEGTYLELGAGPNWPLLGRGATIAIPIKVGLSLNDFYEGPAGDEKFGFFDVGVLVTLPLVGGWNVHGGIDFLALGESTKAFNKGDAGQVLVMGGVGWSH